MLSIIIRKIYFPIMLFLGVLIGVTATNIFHFSVEDYFSTNMIPNMFFGKEYALSQSILFVSSFFYLLFGFLFIKIDCDIFKLTTRKKNILIFLMSAICLMVFVYICIVVYSYFSGKSEPYGLLRILITFFVLACAFIAAYIRLNSKNELFYSSNIFLYDFFVILFFTITTAFLTIHFASPSDIKKHNEDIKSIKELEVIARQVERFYAANSKLPQSLDKLKSKGYLKMFSDDLSQYQLNVHKENEYSLCAQFNYDFGYLRRQSHNIPMVYEIKTMPYKKGEYCYKYQIKKNEKNKVQTIYLSGNLKLKLDNLEHQNNK